MSGIMSMLLGAVSSAAAAADEFFNRVTLLLNTGSTNGAQNNTFLDSSSNTFTITRNGNTTQGTFTPFSQTGWSNYFDGTDDRLSVPDASKLELGSGAFTIECFAYNTVFDTDQNQLFEKGRFSVGKSYRGWMTATAIVFEVNVSGSATGAYTSFSVSTTNNLNQWYHIAFVRSGNNIYIFKDGVQIGSTGTLSGTAFDTSEVLAIGGAADGNNNIMMNGYISNFRIITGQALATGTFSIPTSLLTTSSSGWTVSGSPVSLTGTVALLTCQSNRFVDNSASPLDITVGAGTPSVQAFSPFAPTAAYDTTTVGGSGYFDGSGDYLTVADNANLRPPNGDFTYEIWWYPTSLSGIQGLITKGNGVQIYLASGVMNCSLSSNNTTTYFINSGFGATAPILNAWNHIAVVRSGNSYYGYLNGNRTLLGTSTSFPGTGTNAVGIGAYDSAQYFTSGYLSGARYTTGALYTASPATIPTSPPTTTVSAGTCQLLTNFTNAGIYDAAAKNVLETVGNAQVSTTQAKFGTTSIAFDGTGDYLVGIASSAGMNPQNGDFTVEFWAWIPSLPSAEQPVCATITTGGSGLLIGLGGGGNVNKMQFAIGNLSVGNPTVVDSSTFPVTTWTHIAAVRRSGTIYLYKNGTSVGTPTSASGTLNQPTITIGAWPGGSAVFNGYIDDLRISNFARYTANFTAPTAAFPVQ
jgi:hypothetical protein